MYIGEILRRGTQNLSYIRWSLIGFCVILYTSVLSVTLVCTICCCTVCLGLIWDSDQPPVSDIMAVVNNIGLTLQLGDVSPYCITHNVRTIMFGIHATLYIHVHVCMVVCTYKLYYLHKCTYSLICTQFTCTCICI